MSDLPLSTAPARTITLRSVTLGLAGVVLICGLTPYNDYALNNTFLVGNNLPLGVVMLTFLLVLLVNGPLSRWAPHRALSAGEITVALSMTLVSCALPSSGLMRYFPASIVIPFYHAQANDGYLSLLERLNLPSWIFPSFHGEGPREWMRDPIVSGYYGRWTRPDSPIPYAAWVVPALTWGVFLMAMYGALICMVTLVRRQWMEHERLAFPLAQIHLALVEQPQPGRWFNDILSRRSFWIAFGAMFALHAWNGSARYWPDRFVEIPVWYDLRELFTEPPWSYVDIKIMDAAIFFTVVGVTYFVPGSIAFSLWFFFILRQFYRIGLGVTYNDPRPYGEHDQHLGGVLAFVLMILWIGRHHWLLILRQAFRGHREGEPRGRYLSYPFAFWCMIACVIVMVAWLVAAGATVLGAAFLVILLLTLFMAITRIIAETGLVHGQLQFPLQRFWQILAGQGYGQAVSLKTYYLGATLNSVHYDFREVVPVYASHAIKVADRTVLPHETMRDDTDADRRTGRRFVGLLMLALIVGYFVSFGSTLWTEYHHAWSKDISAKMPINDWGTRDNPMWQILDSTLQYERTNYNPRHNPPAHVTFGFLFTGFLAFMRLRFASWPLHPVGYLMTNTFPGAHLWFSIFIGWLAKALIVRLGGTSLYTSAKPLFLGLIVGESLAAGFWLVIGIVLSALGLPYQPINIMPG